MSRAGRRTEYSTEIADIMLEYFSVDPYQKEVVKEYDDEGNEKSVESGKLISSDFPTLAGFAIKMGVTRQTLANWAEKHPDFKFAYEMAKEYQENFLAVTGMKGIVNTPFAMFVAKNVIGWKDKLPEEKDEFNINISLADELAKARARVNKALDSSEKEE